MMVLTMSTEKCKICETELEFKGYEGNWRIFHCPQCETKINRSTGTVGTEGFTKEDLDNLSKF